MKLYILGVFTVGGCVHRTSDVNMWLLLVSASRILQYLKWCEYVIIISSLAYYNTFVVFTGKRGTGEAFPELHFPVRIGSVSTRLFQPTKGWIEYWVGRRNPDWKTYIASFTQNRIASLQLAHSHDFFYWHVITQLSIKIIKNRVCGNSS